MIALAAILFSVGVIGSIFFAWIAALNRKPGVSLLRAGLMSNLLGKPSLYTPDGLKARGCFLACWCTWATVALVVVSTMIYKRLTE
jgi:hypothetical protein